MFGFVFVLPPNCIFISLSFAMLLLPSQDKQQKAEHDNAQRKENGNFSAKFRFRRHTWAETLQWQAICTRISIETSELSVTDVSSLFCAPFARRVDDLIRNLLYEKRTHFSIPPCAITRLEDLFILRDSFGGWGASVVRCYHPSFTRIHW